MSAEEKVEKRITQHLVDNAFSCLDGFGRLTYALDDCRLIQRFLKEAHGVHLSLSECQRFWRWRSELWDASFLAVHDSEASRKEVLDFFGQWLHEMDLWEWPEVEEGDYIDRQGCPECGLGPCRIDWDYPDGPGWKYEEGGRYESCGVHPERVE